MSAAPRRALAETDHPGETWVNATVGGRFALRGCVLKYRTTKDAAPRKGLAETDPPGETCAAHPGARFSNAAMGGRFALRGCVSDYRTA